MSVIKKLRKIGNSLGCPIPSEVFDLLDIDPASVKFYYRSDEDGKIFVSILAPNVKKLEEKKFIKTGSTWGIIIPNVLIHLWEASIGDEISISLNRKNLNELEIKPTNSK